MWYSYWLRTDLETIQKIGEHRAGAFDSRRVLASDCDVVKMKMKIERLFLKMASFRQQKVDSSRGSLCVRQRNAIH